MKKTKQTGQCTSSRNPPKMLHCIHVSELQARPALSTHIVYPCVRTTSTASSIYTSSVFFPVLQVHFLRTSPTACPFFYVQVLLQAYFFLCASPFFYIRFLLQVHFMRTIPTRTRQILFPVLYDHFLPTIPTRIIKYFSLSSTAIFSLQFLPELSSTFPCPASNFPYPLRPFSHYNSYQNYQVLFPVLRVLFPVLYGHFPPTIPTRIIKYFSLSSTTIFCLRFLPELISIFPCPASTFPCPQNHFGANNF